MRYYNMEKLDNIKQKSLFDHLNEIKKLVNSMENDKEISRRH